MVDKESKYAELGVEARKKSLKSIETTLDNMFPYAFCTMVPDPRLEGFVMFHHTDGAGSKPVQSYLHFVETGNIECFVGLVDDIIAMNIDDIMCVAPEAEAMTFLNYIAINPFRIPKQELLECLVPATKKRLGDLKKYGIDIKFLGGETADLADQLRTLDVSGVISGRAATNNIVTGEKIKPGNVIIELRSGGRAKYEKRKNSGMMCNVITLARHYLMDESYSVKYPEIKNPEGKGYYGRFSFNNRPGQIGMDILDQLGMTVGEAILSPTRIFAPIIKRVFRKHKEDITGFVHNTGGGQTKCLKVGRNIHYRKGGSINGKDYELLEPDPIFYLLQKESDADWREMYEDSNMGGGFEIFAKESAADDIIETVQGFGVDAKVVGKCTKSSGGNKLTIKSKFGKFEYA